MGHGCHSELFVTTRLCHDMPSNPKQFPALSHNVSPLYSWLAGCESVQKKSVAPQSMGIKSHRKPPFSYGFSYGFPQQNSQLKESAWLVTTAQRSPRRWSRRSRWSRDWARDHVLEKEIPPASGRNSTIYSAKSTKLNICAVFFANAIV